MNTKTLASAPAASAPSVHCEGTGSSSGSMTAAHTAHTPGPWRATEDAEVVSMSQNFVAVAKCYASVPDPTHPHGARWMPEDANARLIAAAPDLLAALQNILATDALAFYRNRARVGNEEFKSRDALITNARAAIARAKGAA